MWMAPWLSKFYATGRMLLGHQRLNYFVLVICCKNEISHESKEAIFRKLTIYVDWRITQLSEEQNLINHFFAHKQRHGIKEEKDLSCFQNKRNQDLNYRAQREGVGFNLYNNSKKIVFANRKI